MYHEIDIIRREEPKMDQLQQKTAALFTRLSLENALDSQDWGRILEMSRMLDGLTLLSLAQQAAEKEASA